jgi:UDP-hydrolysing UDP-N-acetyl-D-glucosamine 2-epimerase
MKICVCVTARPSYSRLRSVLLALHAMPDVDLQLVVCASALLERYGSVVQQIEADGLPITERVWNVLEGETLETAARGTGVLLMDLASCFRRLRPDLVVANADRYEVLAVAQAARYSEIPLAHLQGGEVTGSIDDRVRDAITQLADVHLVSTARAAQRVLTMRYANLGRGVVITGCPSIDLCVGVEDEPPVTADELGGAGARMDLSGPFLALLLHPTTDTHAQSHAEAIAVLRGVQATGWPVVAFWPGNEAGADGVSKALRESQGWLHTVRNLAPRRFLRLLTQCQCLVGNSSVGIRECSYLGVPVVNVGGRQRGRERGPNVVDVGFVESDIYNAVTRQVAHGRYARWEGYGDGQAGQRVAETLVVVGRSAGQARATTERARVL